MHARRRPFILFAVVLFAALMAGPAPSATLEVGPGKPYARIESAYKAAKPGDTILVHPRPGNAAYDKTAVLVRKARLTFRAVPANDARWLPVSGDGFDYSGRGSTPRAIFQFDRDADGCLIENFDLSGAHNDSHNGAGARINQANHITIRNCRIHDNDMGVMSNGDGTTDTALDQRFEFCVIDHNGATERAGFSHNLYLGGTSATISFCDVHSSTDGHNVKSRAHHTRVEYSYIHASANREFDLVDADDTARADSDAVLIGNIIVKDPDCKGNKAVIHFGQDGGKEHDGTLFLVHNTIVTPFISPVIDMSAGKAKARLIGNFICDDGAGRRNQQLVNARNGAALMNVEGGRNGFSNGFTLPEGSGLSPKANVVGTLAQSPFVDPVGNDYHLTSAPNADLASVEIALPNVPGVEEPQTRPLTWQYKHPANREARPKEVNAVPGAYGSRSGPEDGAGR